MKNFTIILICIFISAAASVSAQKIVKKSGDMKFLKGQKAIDLKFDYEKMGVGKFNTEEEYINEKVTEHNKKETGKGDKWKDGWINAREKHYEPKFEELANKYLEKYSVSIVKDNSAAKTTCIVKTTFIEPGFNVGVMKKPAFCNYEFLFYDNSSPDKILAKLQLTNVPGSQMSGYDFDASARISESYAKAAKILAKYLEKEVYQ